MTTPPDPQPAALTAEQVVEGVDTLLAGPGASLTPEQARGYAAALVERYAQQRVDEARRELEAARAELKLLRKVVLYADIESTRAKQAYDEWVNNA